MNKTQKTVHDILKTFESKDFTGFTVTVSNLLAGVDFWVQFRDLLFDHIATLVVTVEEEGGVRFQVNQPGFPMRGKEDLTLRIAALAKLSDLVEMVTNALSPPEVTAKSAGNRVPGTFLVREYNYMQHMANMFAARLAGEPEDTFVRNMTMLRHFMTAEEQCTVDYFAARVEDPRCWTPQHFIAFAATMVVDDSALG